jgi:pilus assembly protein CpaF
MPYILEAFLNNIPVKGASLREGSLLIGSRPKCDLELDGKRVANEHARIDYESNRITIWKLAKNEPLLVNNKQILSTILSIKDTITIGDYTLRFTEQGTKYAIDLNLFKIQIYNRLINKLNLAKLKIEELSDKDLWRKCEIVLTEIIESSYIPEGIDVASLKLEILREALGLGPLEKLLEDDSVTEIMVNSKDQIFVERKGRIVREPIAFTTNAQVVNVLARIVNPIGRRIDESSPMVDARLKDGSRVNGIIPPLALQGPTITIRKFSKKKLTTEDLIEVGSLNQNIVLFLKSAVELKKNMIISGGTGSGKTTLLNVLSNFIPIHERVISIEDSAELKLPQENLVSLEARPANIEGAGAISIRELVKNALRMRPDRIVVGECRGGEALDMLQAMNTGHEGSLTTLHANDTNEAILRLETMVLMSGFDLPVMVIRRQIFSAINIIIQQSRLSDGSRKIVRISEVVGMEGAEIILKDIFVFKKTGFDKEGKLMGYYTATGHIPEFIKTYNQTGGAFPLTNFNVTTG